MKLVSNVITGDTLRKAQLNGLKLFSDAVSKTYGPMGGFTGYSKVNVDNKTMAVAYYTKDGATALKNVMVDKPIESLIKDEIVDICTQVIKDVGDGTSSATIISYLVFKNLYKLYEEGNPKRLIIKYFKESINEAINIIESRKRECTLDDIYNIALTSLNGNEEVAEIIRNIYAQYGMDVFIDVQASNDKVTTVKGYDGLVYDEGYIDPAFINNEFNNTCELHDAHIYTFASPIDAPEMLDILKLIITCEITNPITMANNQMKKGLKVTSNPSHVLIVCPFISRDANSYLDTLIKSFEQIPISSRSHLCIVSGMNDDPDNLVDIMKLTGGKFIKKYIDSEQFEKDMEAGLAPNGDNILTFAGRAEKVEVDAISMKIINPQEMRKDGVITEFFKNYVASLKDTLAKYEKTRMEIVKIGKLKKRIHILLGNMVDLYVGGIGTGDRKPLTDSIEDAVLNCRSSAKDGVGFGANYEGLRAFNEMKLKYFDCDNELKYEVVSALYSAYVNLCAMIYMPYFEDLTKAKKLILDEMLDENVDDGPFNIITEEYDGTVLSSIKSEPSILNAMERIISVIFDTNQFLVPDPRFNIYDMEDETMVIDDTSNKDNVEVINPDGKKLGLNKK